MAKKPRNEIHELDPTVYFSDVIQKVETLYPWKGPQSQLACLLGLTRAQISMWSKREDGLVPPPWNWRVGALFEKLEQTERENVKDRSPVTNEA